MTPIVHATNSSMIFIILVAVSGSIFKLIGAQTFRDEMGHFERYMSGIRLGVQLFKNKTLTVSVVIREPFVMYVPPELDPPTPQSEAQRADIGNYSGLTVEILRRLSDIFGFKMVLVRARDGQFGVMDQNKTWTGVVRELIEGKADVGATAMSITWGRVQVIDFTRAYYLEATTFVLRIPEEIRNYSAIFEPFSTAVWCLLMATMVVLILLVTLMAKLEQEQRTQHKIHKLAKFLSKSGGLTGIESGLASESSQEHSQELAHRLTEVVEAETQAEFGLSWRERFYYSISCVLNILMIKDIRHPPRQTPIRILVCVWWLSTIVIVNIYLGILFGQLVVPRRPRTISSLEELVEQRELGWTVTRGSFIHELFLRSPANTVYGQVGKRMETVASAEEGIRRATQSGWPYIRERSILAYKLAQAYRRRGVCQLEMADASFLPTGFGLALQKGSVYLEPFNSALSLMIESGLISRWQQHYWPTVDQLQSCKPSALREGEPLSMKHFLSIYLVCTSIIGIAFTLLLYQLVHEHLLGSLVSKMGSFICNSLPA